MQIDGNAIVNRHTGGLEIYAYPTRLPHTVNRHTGGLENGGHAVNLPWGVNRHTGGLETYAYPAPIRLPC